MAVYKRGYQRYQGPRTGGLTRLLAFPRYAWRQLIGQRLVIVALVASILPIAVAASFIYIANRPDLWRGLLGGGGAAELLTIDGNFFSIFANIQAVLAVLVAALTGPGLIAPDLANGALPLYFSRPLQRRDYVVARLIVLMGLLSLTTWVPDLLLFGMQCSMAGWDWTAANWNIGAGLVAGQMFWILFVSLVALAASAWVKWRIIAGALILGLFFLTGGAAAVINGVFRERWGGYLNPAMDMNNLWRASFGIELSRELEAWPSAISLGVMTLVFIWALNRKLRPVEVVQ